MSQIPRLLRALGEPLLIEPRLGRALVQVFQRKLAGESFDGAALHAELGIETAAQRTRSNAPEPAIAVIPIQGLIAEHPQSLGTSTDEIGAQLEAALASRSISAILFDVDSPGGTVSGVPELAAKIAAARGTKPMLALSRSLMASAAYWLASAADEIMVAPSGEVGSIGVYTAHEDWSRALEAEGVVITPVSAGKYKLEGAPWAPLSEEARAVLQARVDEVYGWFVKAVAAHRGDTQTNVRNGYGEGRVLGAEQSVKAKLADRIGTFEDAVARLSTRIKRTGGASAAHRGRELALDS
jgi:signal peptide peptidase SppA